MASLGSFGLTLGFDSSVVVGVCVVVGVSGDVDPITTPALATVLNALIADGYPSFMVDLGAVTFFGAAGLWALTDASNRLTLAGGSLRVRLASAHLRRVFDIVRLGDLFEDVDPADAPLSRALGVEQRTGDRSLAVVSGAIRGLQSDVARLAAIPASHAVIDAALRLVTALAVETIAGADGVSVSLERRGRLRTVAASNETVLEMDKHQYQTGEGPCIAAADEGHWFHIESLADESRWPAFVPQALEQGIASILSTPLRLADRSIGALNMYSNTRSAFGPPQQKLAAMFATQASTILADAGADLSNEQTAQRVANALADREVIAQAQGILMATHHGTAEEAAALLYRSARTAGSSVARQAAAIVAATGPNLDTTTS